MVESKTLTREFEVIANSEDNSVKIQDFSINALEVLDSEFAFITSASLNITEVGNISVFRNSTTSEFILNVDLSLKDDIFTKDIGQIALYDLPGSGSVESGDFSSPATLTVNNYLEGDLNAEASISGSVKNTDYNNSIPVQDELLIKFEVALLARIP